VDVGTGRIDQLNAQADLTDNKACVYAKNLVAAGIRDIVRSYDNPNLKYVVLVGGDSSIPFFRYPDPSTDLAPESWYVPPIGPGTPSEATLKSNYVLGQDEYGTSTVLSLGGTKFPVPERAVGRLVETASEALAALNADLVGTGASTTLKPAVSPTTSLVTGYEFLTDSSTAVKNQLQLGTNATPDSLINDTWTADQLRTKLLTGPKKNVVYLAGHFDANQAFAPDGQTSVNATELLPASVDLLNTLVFSTGCHAGYNLVDSDGITGVTQTADWAQILAQKGATLVAGTGFQYGDDELIEYSERIYAEFAHQLRVGAGPVSVGQALVKSKLAYLAATPEIKGMHEKALLTASVFGLPMFAINMGGSRDTSVAGGSQITPNNALGVTSGDLALTNSDFQVPAAPVSGPAGTTYFTGRDGVASNPGEPALPRYVANVDVPGKILRGVGFRSGAFTDTNGVKPFTGAPGTEFGGAQTPFTSPTFYPARFWAASYFAELTGGATSLVVTPAQHRVINVGDATATRRLFSSLGLRLFYVNDNDADAALAAAPAISDVHASLSGSIVTFSARIHGTDVHGADNLKTAWVTYTFGPTGCSCWTSVDLTRNPAVDPNIWTATLDIGAASSANLRFMVQAANGAALVGVDDNDAAFHSLANSAVGTPEATALDLTAPPSGTYGGSANVSATLTSNGSPLANKLVTFRIGTAIATDDTDANGIASAVLPILADPGSQEVVATFAGEPTLAGSSDTSAFDVASPGTTLTLTSGPTTGSDPGSPSGVSALLTTGTPATPIAGRTITFVATGSGVAAGQGFVKSVTTNAAGVAALGPTPSVPGGPYSITAYFSGTIPLHPWGPPPASITLEDPIYQPSVSNAGVIKVHWPFTGYSSPVDNPPTVNTANAGSGIPVKFSLGGDRGLNILAAGSPSISQFTCTNAPTDPIEETSSALTSSLSFSGGQYVYNWKTLKSYAGNCYQFKLTLVDGSIHIANFKFK
jgi:hypothetical protein